jgi:hypothetical protein
MNKKHDKNEKLVIVVCQPRAYILPPVKDASDPHEREGVTLIPGENNVSRDLWDKVKDNPGVKIHHQTGVLKNKGAGKAVSVLSDWESMTPKQVEDMISGIKEIDTVRKIEKQLKSKKAIAYCKQRVEQILEENEKDSQ